MKKTPCSLGTYVLKNVELTMGREGGGYYAELWKGKKQIGTLEDWGDGGGVNPRFNYDLTQEDRAAIEQEVLADMIELQKLCNVDKGSLAEHWVNTPYGAMEGFGELLLELTELTKQSKSAQKKSNGNPFAVFQIGDHWFRNFEMYSYCATQYYSLQLGISAKKDYDKIIKSAITKQLPKNEQKIVMLRYVDGKNTWSLSFKEYALLLENARRLQTLKS